MSRTDTIPVCDGGEALHVNTKKTGEGGGFNLTDRRKALGHVRNRALMLAELFTESRRQSRRHVSVFRQGDCKSLGRRRVGFSVGHPFLVASFALPHAGLCETRYGIGPGPVCQDLPTHDR